MIILVDDSSSLWTYTGGWNVRSPSTPCPSCRANPDPSQAYNHTWHDTTDPSSSASITFKGVSVAVYSILPIGPPIEQYLFSLNGVASTPFVYNDSNPPATYSFNTQILSASSLNSQASTTLTINIPEGLLLLDYLTYDDGVSTSPSGTGSSSATPSASSTTTNTPSPHTNSFPVAAVVVPTIVISIFLALIVYLLWRRRNDNRQFFFYMS